MSIFKNIAAALGWGDNHETSADGVFLQPEEAATLDNALQPQEAAEVTSCTSCADLTTQLQTANATISERDARIQELEAENTRLGAQRSGTGTTLAVAADTNTETGKVPSYLDDNSPENQWLDKRMNRKKAQ